MIGVDKKVEITTVGDVVCANGSIESQVINMNVYSFEVDGILIDTGAQSLLNEFKPFLQTADFDKVVFTHIHEDHTGCASWIEENRKVPQYIHPISVKNCADPEDYPQYRHIVWGDRAPFHALPLGKTFESRTTTWDVIETPGHATDHLAFYNRKTKTLFSGDLYVKNTTKVVLRDESIPQIIRSIERVLTYDFNDVFCCHAGYLANGRALFQDKLEILKNLVSEVTSLYMSGLTAEEIKDKLFPKKYPITQFSDGEWDSLHIVTSIIAEYEPVKK